MRQDMILVLDLGSEENPRLAREIRALGVYSEIHPHDITKEELEALPNVKGIILNGGPNRVVDGVEIDVSQDIYNAPVPVLMADHKGDAPWSEDEQARKEALSNFVFGGRWEIKRSCWLCPAGWTPQWWRRCSSGRWEASSPVFTSTMAFCGRANRNRWFRCSAMSWGQI